MTDLPFLLLLVLSIALLGRAAMAAVPTADAGEPFGVLPLVDEVRCGDAADPHQLIESPAGASRIKPLLGRSCRLLPNAEGPAYFAYKVGVRKGLEPGAAYVLEVEYPEDAPRTVYVLNRGCETARGFHTGATIGDTAVGYTDNALESLRIPLSGGYERWRMFFFLHDRFPGVQQPRGEGPRPDVPADGFLVIIAEPGLKQAPRSAGAAVSRIRLFRVPDPDALSVRLRPPPEGLPRRHVFWREEMADGVIQSAEPTKRGLDEPLDWYKQKARLMRFLGVNTFCKDLLEFGHNQGWDSAVHGGNDWVYQTPYPERWGQVVAIATRHGLDVLPYYEYAGSVGAHGLGSQKRCITLAGTRDYTNISWTEKANADVTDPDTQEDARKVLQATIVRHSEKARFVGAWFRTRPSHMPVSFSDRCLALFAEETGRGDGVSRQILREDEKLRERYYEWWFGKRRDFLVRLRDCLRAEANPEAVLLFTPDPREPGPHVVPNHRVVTTDDTETWRPLLKELWGRTISPRDWDTVVANGLHLKAALAWHRNWKHWEQNHASPPPDPVHYAKTEGVLLTYPFHRAYSVARPEPMDLFRGPAGLALVRHYPLNENMMGEEFGYFVIDVERAGPYCMLAEARAVANGDPTHLGYLAAASFNRGFPEHVRRFNAAFLALPALPSKVLNGASSRPRVVVRAIRTEEHGTWLAVVNTGLETVERAEITLPAPGTVTDAATGEDLSPEDGVLTVSLGPCELRALHLQ